MATEPIDAMDENPWETAKEPKALYQCGCCLDFFDSYDLFWTNGEPETAEFIEIEPGWACKSCLEPRGFDVDEKDTVQAWEDELKRRNYARAHGEI